MFSDALPVSFLYILNYSERLCELIMHVSAIETLLNDMLEGIIAFQLVGMFPWIVPLQCNCNTYLCFQ
jgi:hypothetical protein